MVEQPQPVLQLQLPEQVQVLEPELEQELEQALPQLQVQMQQVHLLD
jgi:hypothetical protein